MSNNDLYAYAQKEDITIDTLKIKTKKSFSCTYGGKDFIAVNKRAMKNSADERTCIAHELGHCATGAFYEIGADDWARNRAESKATRWAVKKLIPKAEFECLLKQGYRSWELAEYYNVTEDFVTTAYKLYFEDGMMT